MANRLIKLPGNRALMGASYGALNVLDLTTMVSPRLHSNYERRMGWNGLYEEVLNKLLACVA